MTYRQAEEYIAGLTLEERLKLNDLIKGLERMRQRDQAPPAKENTGDL